MPGQYSLRPGNADSGDPTMIPSDAALDVVGRGALVNPTLYREIARLERHIRHTMAMNGVPIEQITGIAA